MIGGIILTRENRMYIGGLILTEGKTKILTKNYWRSDTDWGKQNVHWRIDTD
jgi:hypothetical protein